MTVLRDTSAPVRNGDRFFIDGEWVRPASDAMIDVVDSGTEQLYFQVAQANAVDMARAVAAARAAFDDGPWPRLTHGQRAEYMRGLAAGLRGQADAFADVWTRESGILRTYSASAGPVAAATFEYYADLAATYPFEELVRPTSKATFGLLVREPVGVVGAIIPWNAPLGLIAVKVAPALLAGCTVILKSSPEAPGEGYRPPAGCTQRRDRRP
jgi:aldehyde dehydrogenase (NAD+)